MAAEDADEVEEEEQKTRVAAKTGRDLERVTDYGAESELDNTKAQEALSKLTKSDQEEREARLARAKELAAVVVKKEDVDLVMSELEVDKETAQSALQESGGDVVIALRQLIK